MPKEVIGGPIEIRSSKAQQVFLVRHLNDNEFQIGPAIAIEGKMGTVWVSPGQLQPLITALVEMMEEVI